MTKPKFETWFCESLLIPGQHYIEIESDFSNLDETLEFYLSHPNLTNEIAKESKEYASKFINLERQFSIGRKVVEKYFQLAQHLG